jgi:hypothetical protein
MRRILVPLAVAALAAGVAEAAFGSVPVPLRTPGAELFELQGGHGRAALTKRGSIFISIGRGRLRIIDLVGPGRPNLNDSCRQRGRQVSARTLEISGRNIRCRVWSGDNGGRWQVIIRGRGINVSGSVLGSLTLDGADTGAIGTYRIGGRSERPWPRSARTYVLNSA